MEQNTPSVTKPAYIGNIVAIAAVLLFVGITAYALLRYSNLGHGLYEPSDEEVLTLLKNAEQLLYDVENAALLSETDNRVQIGDAVFCLLPDQYGSRELLENHYSQCWDSKTIKTLSGYPCYVLGDYAYPLGQLGAPTDWEAAQVVSKTEIENQSFTVHIGFGGVSDQYKLMWEDDKWKVNEAPILGFYPEQSRDVVSIVWNNGTFVGYTKNNSPDGYGVFTRTLLIDGVNWEQEMVGTFAVMEDAVFDEGVPVESTDFDGKVTVTRAGNNAPSLIFNGKNIVNSVFEGTFFLAPGFYQPMGLKLEGSFNFNGEFYGDILINDVSINTNLTIPVDNYLSI